MTVLSKNIVISIKFSINWTLLQQAVSSSTLLLKSSHGMKSPSFIIPLLLYSTCITIATYVSFINLKLYIKDEDSSAFKIKSYHLEETSQYPDISVCFWASNRIFDQNIMPFHISNSEMMRIMMGHSTNFSRKIVRHLGQNGNSFEYYLRIS